MHGFLRTSAVVFSATMLAACGSSTSPSSKTSTTGPPSTNVDTNFDSCSVVTQEEAASALGETITAAGVLGTATVEGGLACVFYGPSAPKPADPNVGQPDSVRVVVVKGPEASRWYNDYKSKVTASPISGYGDEAYYDGVASLNVLKGANYLRIAVVPAVGPPSLSGEQQLAAAILRKL